MLKVKETGDQPVEEAPFVAHDERVIEVDCSKVSSPYHFLSYTTIKKLGIAMTTIGAAFLSLCGLTMVDVFRDIYVFYIPGLAVILAGSFGISAAKVKRRQLKKGLVIVTVILLICAIAGALYSLVTAVQIMIANYNGKIDILLVLRIGVAVVVVAVAGMMLAITLDSLLCGRHRPGYSTMVRLVCKAEDIEMDQLDGVNRNMHKSHDHSRHHAHQRNHHGNGSPRPDHHGHHSRRPRHHGGHSPRPHGNNSPRHLGDHSPRLHGDRSPRPHSPHHHGDLSSPLTGHNGDQKRCNKHGGHHKDHKDHHHHHHHHHHRHQRENVTTEKSYSGLEHMASLERSTDHKHDRTVEENRGWDVLNRM